MIEYPPDLPATARTTIERALADAEGEFIDASGGAGPGRSSRVLARDITYVGMWDQADRAAVSYVLEVFEVILQVTCVVARDGRWRADKLRTTTADLLAQLTTSAFREKHSKGVGGFGPVTLDDFSTMVYRESRTFASWRDYQDTLRELSAPADERLVRRAAWLQRELGRRGLTLSRLEKAGGRDRKTTKKLLAGAPVSENVSHRLAKALGLDRGVIP